MDASLLVIMVPGRGAVRCVVLVKGHRYTELQDQCSTDWHLLIRTDGFLRG